MAPAMAKAFAEAGAAIVLADINSGRCGKRNHQKKLLYQYNFRVIALKMLLLYPVLNDRTTTGRSGS
jgi:hypothetical protein